MNQSFSNTINFISSIITHCIIAHFALKSKVKHNSLEYSFIIFIYAKILPSLILLMKKMVIIMTIQKYILQEYFELYMSDVEHLAPASVKKYVSAISKCSDFLRQKTMIKDTLYEVADITQLKNLRDILLTDEEFYALNSRGNHMYSAGFNKYIKFAEGENFEAINDAITPLYKPFPKTKTPTLTSTAKWTRNHILRQQVIKLADYKCEINPAHQSFIAENTQKPYMEGHHAIPMKYQEHFSYSLDVYANIICLCPICHRKIHYGLKNDRHEMMNQLYEQNSSKLIKSGIEISKTEFANLDI